MSLIVLIQPDAKSKHSLAVLQRRPYMFLSTTICLLVLLDGMIMKQEMMLKRTFLHIHVTGM